MWAFFMALLPLLGGVTQPLKDYISYKQQAVKADQDYKLAVLKSNTDQAVQNRVSDSNDLAVRIGMTSQGFKQDIYIWFAAILTFSILCPTYAATMWVNFAAIPVWFTDLFKIMTLAAWGIPTLAPYMQRMFSAGSDAVQARRDYKLEKARINRDAVAAALRKKWFPKGMNQAETNDLDAALDAGEAGQNE